MARNLVGWNVVFGFQSTRTSYLHFMKEKLLGWTRFRGVKNIPQSYVNLEQTGTPSLDYHSNRWMIYVPPVNGLLHWMMRSN